MDDKLHGTDRGAAYFLEADANRSPHALEAVMFRTWYQFNMLALESQQVILLRMMKLAGGGPKARREAALMLREKVDAASQSSLRLAGGASVDSVVHAYRRKVRANARRLSR